MRDALEAVERALEVPRPFEPATLRRTLRVMTSDYAELVLLPAVLERLASLAPNLDIWVLPSSESVREPLSRGEADLAFALQRASERPVPGIRAEQLFTDRFVVVTRKGHPLTRGKLTLERYASARHAFIAPRGRRGGVVDEALAQNGYVRRVALAVPHALVAPHAVARTDLVITMAERVAETYARTLPLAISRPPLKLPEFSVALLWNERFGADPALVWVRQQIVSVARELSRRQPREA